jgi:putative flippase GtrA
VLDGQQAPPSRSPKGLIGRLIAKFQHLIHELGKFGVVGAVAFGIDAAIFNALLSAEWETVLAKGVSTAIAATVAFCGNRFWTWRHRERSGLAREYGLYFFFNAVGLAIGLICVAASHYGLGYYWPEVFQTTLADNISGLFIGNVFGTLFRFWSYRRFVFPEAAPQPSAGTAGPDVEVDAASTSRTADTTWAPVPSTRVAAGAKRREEH